MRLKLILSALLLLSLLFVISCAGTPPNVPLCVELSPERAHCVRIMTSEQFEVNEERKLDGKTWWEHKPSVISMPATTWRELKKWIIKICKNNQACDSQVASWDRTVETIDSKINN